MRKVPTKGLEWACNGSAVCESRLLRMVEILLLKYSENFCGRSLEAMEEGRGEDFDLPRSVYNVVQLLGCSAC